MAARDLVELLRAIDTAGIEVWLDGGWGVDALLGAQRREHDDVDLIPSLAEMPRLLQLLELRGYELVDGELPASIVLHDGIGRQVDVHPVNCLTPKAQVLCHAGYEFDEDDIADLDALRERFGVTATPASSRE